MLALEDNSFASVQIDNYGNPRVMDCQIEDTIMKLPNWRIDAGGRVLMRMNINIACQDPIADFFKDDLYFIVEPATRRKRLHRRQARDAAGYTWKEFLQWYVHPQLAFTRWCAAPNVH